MTMVVMTTMPIGAAIAWLAERDPHRPAITDPTGTVTRLELDRRTSRLARAYAELGVGQDSLVTIGLPNGIEFYEAAIAVWKLGATPQPVSSKLPARERAAIIELADPPLVVGVAEDIPGRHRVAAGFQPDPSLSDEPLPPAVASSWKAPTSGGSTGRPKIILAGEPGTADPERATSAGFGMEPNGVQLVPGPLYHNAPFAFSTRGLLSGAHLIVMSRFDASEALALIERHRVDWVLMVP
ncbi:MAG: bile acid-coenzyme ligase, partial [Acidimicrobiaceae bacterium]|nr:bile acid-coenzyme ligase [Acidimicrobiaceae bacterium]